MCALRRILPLLPPFHLAHTLTIMHACDTQWEKGYFRKAAVLEEMDDLEGVS